MREHYYFWIPLGVSIAVIAFGYAASVFESILDREDSNWNLYNGMWFAFVTMSTVGYGDYFPITLPGRLISGISFLTGAFFMSLITVVLSMQLELSIEEEKVFINFSICRRLDGVRSMKAKLNVKK